MNEKQDQESIDILKEIKSLNLNQVELAAALGYKMACLTYGNELGSILQLGRIIQGSLEIFGKPKLTEEEIVSYADKNFLITIAKLSAKLAEIINQVDITK